MVRGWMATNDGDFSQIQATGSFSILAERYHNLTIQYFNDENFKSLTMFGFVEQRLMLDWKVLREFVTTSGIFEGKQSHEEDHGERQNDKDDVHCIHDREKLDLFQKQTFTWLFINSLSRLE